MMPWRFTQRLILPAAMAAWMGLAVAQTAQEFNKVGIEAYNVGQYESAIAYFEEAYQQAPHSDVVRRNLCNAHQACADGLAKEGDFRKAAEHLELAIGIDADNPAPLVQLGSYYLRLDMVPEAIGRLEEAIEIKPGELTAHEMLGEAYYRDNDLPSARAQWDYVLEMEPDRPALQERYDKAFREESVEYNFSQTLSGSRHFKLSYPKNLPYQVRARVLTLLEKAYFDIGRKLGAVYPPPPIQVIIYDAEQFSKATELDAHVGAVYDGKIRSPVMNASGKFLPDEELKRRLTHEYVHVVVRHLAGANVPWWLNEGLAQTFSEELGERERKMLRLAYEQGIDYALSNIEDHQLNKLPPEALRLAYVQSHATVVTLWARYGQRRLIQMMQCLASGMAPEQALRSSYRRTYRTLQSEVAASYR